MEIMKLIRQDVCVRHEIKLISAKSLLHFDYIVAKPIFSSDFVTLWEMVDPLEFIKTFV